MHEILNYFQDVQESTGKDNVAYHPSVRPPAKNFNLQDLLILLIHVNHPRDAFKKFPSFSSNSSSKNMVGLLLWKNSPPPLSSPPTLPTSTSLLIDEPAWS